MAFVIGAYRLDDTQRVVYRDATIVPLTPKLVDTLAVLAEAEGAIVSREALIDRIWKDTAVTDSSLTQNVWLLRRALEQDGTPYIETIPRRGYRLTVPVRREGSRVESTAPARHGPTCHAPSPHWSAAAGKSTNCWR
jgi:DNA-binding winged helix-turn-helix (wHTH) protein